MYSDIKGNKLVFKFDDSEGYVGARNRKQKVANALGFAEIMGDKNAGAKLDKLRREVKDANNDGSNWDDIGKYVIEHSVYEGITGSYSFNLGSASATASTSQKTENRKVQQALVGAGYPIDVDGIIGPKTKAALKKYATENGMDANSSLEDIQSHLLDSKNVA